MRYLVKFKFQKSKTEHTTGKRNPRGHDRVGQGVQAHNDGTLDSDPIDRYQEDTDEDQERSEVAEGRKRRTNIET